MWAELPAKPRPAEGQPSPLFKAAADTLVNGVKRDYAAIRGQLKKANVPLGGQPVPTLDSLVKEVQDHYLGAVVQKQYLGGPGSLV